MAKAHMVILHGGPMDGEAHMMDAAHNRLTFAQPMPAPIFPGANHPMEPFKVRHIEYDILGGYAPYPDDHSQVYRLGILRGLDPAVELLKILMKGNQHG